MEGHLSKWTNVMKGWQYRWFVLDDNAGLLSYYTSKEKMTKGVRRGCVRLKGAVVGIDDEDDATFTVTVDGKIFHLQARDPEEREKWLRVLEDTIFRHAQLQRKLDPNRPPPTMKDFDKKLTESDAYLQLLIEQIKNIETKMQTLPDEAEKQRLTLIRDKANDMLESIKHSIVLLQIAKNTSHPINGVNASPSQRTEITPPPRPVLGENLGSVMAAVEPPPLTGIEMGRECLERSSQATLSVSSSPAIQAPPSPHAISTTSTPPLMPSFPSMSPSGLAIPETSYSSSEDEDFYDANEYMASSPSHVKENLEKSFEKVEKAIIEPAPATVDTGFDYDALYEDDSEDDIGSMESHGSVISHLISQVKIGMDLTKVVLPTFILERRSLLEMYADFFAHPDIFVSIPTFSDPKDRLVQVVRWFLSAFHAGRKSEVAKKPYNPILGETFSCVWDPLPTASSNECVAEGPVPWCKKSQLSFIAEQVSHHPPISAFYAEHYERRISFCAHIWTKSKFLGLSVGVQHVGQGCISLLDYDEEYIVTFPNAYGRSILTIPWVELGGSVSITCAKTGYSAQVEFLTKPFYGGKKNRITADLFQPNDKKPFLSVAGEWNGAMVGKWADGRTEDFVNVNRLEILRKKVRPVVEQDEFESRKLWKDVTAGLKFNNIPKATASKAFLEHRQREEARIRKEQAVSWETKHFHLLGENWIYDTPLQKRLNESK